MKKIIVALMVTVANIAPAAAQQDKPDPGLGYEAALIANYYCGLKMPDEKFLQTLFMAANEEGMTDFMAYNDMAASRASVKAKRMLAANEMQEFCIMMEKLPVYN